jgi:hypothetical protein
MQLDNGLGLVGDQLPGMKYPAMANLDTKTYDEPVTKC